VLSVTATIIADNPGITDPEVVMTCNLWIHRAVHGIG
jgi:hypothetical protein